MITEFVDVIIPQSLPKTFSYRLPQSLTGKAKVGVRVVVPFGKTKLLTGIVSSINTLAPTAYEAKYVESILDEAPIVNHIQLQFWNWIASYYLCNIGDVMSAALPSGLKLSSETKYLLRNKFIDEQRNLIDSKTEILTDKEYLIAEALSIRHVLTLEEMRVVLGIKTIHPIIKSLLEKKVIFLEQKLIEKFKPKLETFIQLNSEYEDEKKLELLINSLEKKAFKQLELVLQYLKICNFSNSNFPEIKKNTLLEGKEKSEAALASLIKKNIFNLKQKQKDRFYFDGQTVEMKPLNDEQTNAFELISEYHKSKEVVLLHGITGSGKTEVYIKLIEEVIKGGKQVLYLLPEIALTTQAIVRLQKVFGDKVGVYHSRQNESERVEIWNRVLYSEKNNTYPLVLGARSSLFLPFSNLGLIIIDEEHDFSYKQNEPAPRYHARDAAIYLAMQHKAKVLLGTATPSIESYYNTQVKKYGLARINNRFGDSLLPKTSIVDMRKYRKEKNLHSYFSNELIEAIAENLEKKKQVILFQNRRGFSPMLECRLCAHIPQCINCDVSLTYHKGVNILRCHYCGYSTPPPQVCVKCGGTEILMKGAGTEKIEEELQVFFQDAKIARMDLDTTRSKYAFQQIIYEFEEGNIDILVGTQMVSKGLDFANVGLVGVINADSLLHYPNFRSFERCYQLLIQVSGRAGRGVDLGSVIIQTANPENKVIQQVLNNNYPLFFESQIEERKNFNYPPFSKLIELNLRSKDINELNVASQYLADNLKTQFGKRLLGPEFPPVKKIRNQYHKNILIKIEKDTSIISSKKIIMQHIQAFNLNKEFKKVLVIIDVDVYS